MIGIIGFGRFGRLTTRYLARDFKVNVANRKGNSSAVKTLGGIPASLEKVCAQKYIILCVPISTLKNVLMDIAPIINKNAIVVDVCSVKEAPIRWMESLLPETVSILATHPMFGPDSASKSLQGCKIFLNNTRIDKAGYEKVKNYLHSLGLILIEGTPEEHDSQIAVSLALTHFIGRGLEEFGACPLDIDTEGYKRLLHILGVVEHDTWQLFLDMNRYNPYARQNRCKFMDAMKKIDAQLVKQVE